MPTLEEMTPDRAMPHNLFEDMGMSDPETRQAKAMVSILIEQRIDELGLTQAQAAERMGLRQPEVSEIVRGVNSGFSFERLLEALAALGNGIEIVVHPAAPERERGFLRVTREGQIGKPVRPVGASSPGSPVVISKKSAAHKRLAKTSQPN